MSASAQIIDLADAPVSPTLVDPWQPVESTAHLGNRGASDAFLSIVPDHTSDTPRGHRRTTWRH